MPNEVRELIIELALDEPELSPRELAVRFTDTEKDFVSVTSVDCILKKHDLITSPAFAIIRTGEEFADKMSHGRAISPSDNGEYTELARADRLQIPEDHRLELVLPLDDP